MDVAKAGQFRVVQRAEQHVDAHSLGLELDHLEGGGDELDGRNKNAPCDVTIMRERAFETGEKRGMKHHTTKSRAELRERLCR